MKPIPIPIINNPITVIVSILLIYLNYFLTFSISMASIIRNWINGTSLIKYFHKNIRIIRITTSIIRSCINAKSKICSFCYGIWLILINNISIRILITRNSIISITLEIWTKNNCSWFTYGNIYSNIPTTPTKIILTV